MNEPSTMLDVIEGRARWCVVTGDALAVLSGMPDGCADAVVTDGPYSSGGQYRGDRVQSTGSKYVQTGTKIARPDFAGDGRDQRSFAFWSALWLSEALRVAREGSPLAMFSDWRQVPSTTDAIQAGGWVWRGLVPWDKTEACRPTIGRFASQAEWILLGGRDGEEEPEGLQRLRESLSRDVLVWGSAGAMAEDRGVGCLAGVIREPIKLAEKHHQTGKPIGAMRKVNAITKPGGLILDPFTGGGSTGVAALRDGYRFIGIEKTEAYAAIAREWLAAEEQGLTLADSQAGQIAIPGFG